MRLGLQPPAGAGEAASEPGIDPFVSGATMTTDAYRPQVCPDCGSADLLPEPATNADGLPTGLLLLTCVSCGRELGELPALAPAREAEPEEESLPLGSEA